MDTVQNPSIMKKVSMEPGLEIITDQLSNCLLLFFKSYFCTISVFVHFSLFKKWSPWTPSITGGA